MFLQRLSYVRLFFSGIFLLVIYIFVKIEIVFSDVKFCFMINISIEMFSILY